MSARDMADPNIRSELGADGVLLAAIDMPGRSMNVFSLELMDSLQALIERVEQDPAIRAVVLASGKREFLAGADLAMIRMFTERARSDGHAELVELCGRLGRIFRRLERCPKPFVAAINGLALGGGLELGLACHGRVASDRRGVLLGLPEIRLGLLPGAGGTQRLPRMLGPLRGLGMLLKGDPLGADEALQLELVDAVVPADELLACARARALALADNPLPKPWDAAGGPRPSGKLAFAEPGADRRVVEALGLAQETIGCYPAYKAIIDCVIGGWAIDFDTALDREMDIFVGLIRDPVAGNMVRSLFLERQRSLKVLAEALATDGLQVAVCGPAADLVRSQLASGRAPIVDVAQTRPQDIQLLTDGAPGTGAAKRLAWLGTGELPADCAAGLWAGARGEHGLCVEVVAREPGSDRAAALAVARWLRADAVLDTTGSGSLLADLSARAQRAAEAGCDTAERTLALALRAATLWKEGRIADPAIFDSACVVAGLVPAHTGGPLNLLTRRGADEIVQAAKVAAGARGELLFSVPEELAACCEREGHAA